MKRRVMYVEHKGGDGTAWIGWVTFSKTGRTVYTRGLRLQRSGGLVSGNHVDLDTGEEYWVSGVKKNGQDRHYAEPGPVEIEADAHEEYRRLTGR